MTGLAYEIELTAKADGLEIIKSFESFLDSNCTNFPVYMGRRFGWDSLWVEVYEDVEIDLYKEVITSYISILNNEYYKCERNIPTYTDMTDYMMEWFYERVNEQMVFDLEQDGKSLDSIDNDEWEDLESDYMDFASYNQYYECFQWQVSKCINDLRLTIIDDDGYYGNEGFTICNDAQTGLFTEGDDCDNYRERNRNNSFYLQ